MQSYGETVRIATIRCRRIRCDAGRPEPRSTTKAVSVSGNGARSSWATTVAQPALSFGPSRASRRVAPTASANARAGPSSALTSRADIAMSACLGTSRIWNAFPPDREAVVPKVWRWS